MKRQLTTLFILIIALTVVGGFAIIYHSGYAVPSRWVHQHQISNSQTAIVRMILNNNGQGIISQNVYDTQPPHSHKTSTNTYILWKEENKVIQIYKSNRTYSQRDHLLASASIIGFGKLQMNYTRPQKHVPTEIVFSKMNAE